MADGFSGLFFFFWTAELNEDALFSSFSFDLLT